jgi:hypothetical protein
MVISATANPHAKAKHVFIALLFEVIPGFIPPAISPTREQAQATDSRARHGCALEGVEAGFFGSIVESQ